jgi:osomolarity two-component system, sensor histidine kinase TcsA
MDMVTKALDGNVPAMSEIFDFLPVPTLVVSPSYRIQRASAGLLEAWGRRREELIDQDLFIALYRGSPTERFDRIPFINAIEAALAARALRLCYAAYIANGISWTARIMPVHRDGELLCLILEWDKAELYITLPDGGIAQSLLPIEDVFRILIQDVKDYAIFLLDTRGNVMTWNTGAELNKGYKREEIIGKHFSTFYGEEDIRSRKPERELEICLREGRVEDEGWRYRKDGSRFWANVVITAIYKNDIHVGFGKVTRNLTERREAELRLIAAYEESTKLKNDFLANISHEIRTPMHGVLSACSLLLDSRLTEEQRETANMIKESGHVLLRIMNDILDYSKIAAGSLSIKNDKVDIASVVTSVVRSVQTTVQPGVSLRLKLSPNLPKWAGGDPLKCRQVVENIVSNAVKFTEQGYIMVSVSLLAEDVATHTILTEVYDTGHGVTEDDAQKLFKPFTQLDTPYQKRRQGTGLGLSIAKSLAELLGGNVGYKPNPERQGSIFWFAVKLKKLNSLQQDQTADALPDPSSDLSRQEVSQGEDLAAQLTQLVKISPTARILAAEDNIINQKILVGMLHSFGFQHITVVSDGAQAVSTLSAAADAFDLILMDISMPVMNGYEATVQIRNSGIRLPIIAMTAYALKGDMEHCLEKGMDDYIAKPMNRQLLMKKLLKWLVRPGGAVLTITARERQKVPPCQHSTSQQQC